MPEVLEVLEVCSKCAAAGRAAGPGASLGVRVRREAMKHGLRTCARPRVHLHLHFPTSPSPSPAVGIPGTRGQPSD